MNEWVSTLRNAAMERGIIGLGPMLIFAIKYLIIGHLTIELASHIPNFLVPYLHRFRGAKVGKGVFIDRSAYLDNLYPELITIEQGARITAHCVLVCHTSPSHQMKQSFMPFDKKPILIRQHAFIGVNSTILPGVTVGEYSVVAAGAVVVKDVESFHVVGGNPAKTIKLLRHVDNTPYFKEE